MRSVFAVLCVVAVALAAGCSATPRTLSAPPVQAPIRTLESTAHVEPDRAVESVRLAGGEPTGSDPYRRLDALSRKYPGVKRYEVSYTVAGSSRAYRVVWLPPVTRLEWWSGTGGGPVVTLIGRGMVPYADAKLVHDVAAGVRKPPGLLGITTRTYTDPELAALDATGVAEAYFASGNQEIEYWLSARFVQVNPKTDPWHVGDLERMWGIDNLVVRQIGSAHLGGDASKWSTQLEYDVSYRSRTYSRHGDTPGLRHYSLVVGRQGDQGAWQVLRMRELSTGT